MDAITLVSQPYKIAAITRKTKAALFKDAVVGDTLRFSLAMTAPGSRTRGGSYAVSVRVENVTQGTHTYVTLNCIGDRLDCFALEPHVSAEVIPFPNPVAETFEQFGRLARAGEVTGVVLAALGPGRLDEDTYSAVSGVNYTERRALIQTLEDGAAMALIDAQDDY
jgi:hypothetical protein